MLLLEHLLAGRGCLLLWLLLSVLRAQPSEEARPRSMPCQQSPMKVSCKGVGLRKFPKELGQGVKYLELSNNFIQNLSGSYLPGFGQLEYLDMCFNQLEAVSATTLAQLSQLRSLLLGSNHLDRNYRANGRAFRLLRSIEVLDLSANNLESHMAGWYISNLTRLRMLDLSRNKMTRLPVGIFWSMPQLRELNLSNNYIMEIEEGAFEALELLEVVNLALNSLHCISGFSLTQLRVLNLSHNALELFISEEGAEPYLLQVLDLSHNRLLYFPELPKAHYLTHLNLSNNLIASLLPGSRHPEEFVPRYMEMARFNRTLHTAAGLTHVADLDLSNNRLQLFPFTFFHSLGSLHSLSLAMNCLQDVAREPLTGGTEPSDRSPTPLERATLSVHSLDLHSNAICVLPRWFFDYLPQLEAIDLGSNSLQPCESPGSDRGGNSGEGSPVPAPGGTCTPFYNVPHLKHLSLCKNNIARLQPYAFNRTSLLSLDLSGNKDLFMPKEALGGLEFSLQKLSLRGNQMDNSKAELPCLDTLKVLDLSGNNLSLLPTGLFCCPLESLNIRNNNLLTLEKPALVSWSHSLKDVSVAGNPFSCCSLAWLDTLRAAGVGVRDLDEALCAYRDQSRNFSAKITSSPRWLCPPPKDTISLAPFVVVMSLFFLSFGACCLLKKGQKVPECAGLQSNRVGVFPPHPKIAEPAQVSSPHQHPACFANQIKGVWLVLSSGLGRGGLWATSPSPEGWYPHLLCSLQDVKCAISTRGWVFCPAVTRSHHPGQETKAGAG
ncbi:transforming growth factor beta activator LRRC32-like isoform X1 [Falco biarmicus]|uniref:transforming growth factor beta activator LRRC32-like isoform X1 n=1 Tax=Falco cherrug TaxID=345164 RepID=UPI00247ACDB2|nr:transforming growth factor beta activator LRRC32-like isoform X1 [Falco cherrug]XP_056215934.1 transforming growth factor beta activator LRRC32-like isoform X1 [Falco biarmicus]